MIKNPELFFPHRKIRSLFFLKKKIGSLQGSLQGREHFFLLAVEKKTAYRTCHTACFKAEGIPRPSRQKAHRVLKGRRHPAVCFLFFQ